MIICNLRICVCHTREERRFSYIWKSDQPNIRNHFQFQIHPEFLCRLSWLCILRHLHRRSCKMLIAKSSFSSPENYLSSIFSGHICDHLVRLCLFDDRSFWNFQDDIRRILPMTSALSTLFSIFCDILSSMTVICKCVESVIYFKDHISAFSAVSSVRSAVWHIQFSPETCMSIPAFSGTDINFCSVCKHINLFL